MSRERVFYQSTQDNSFWRFNGKQDNYLTTRRQVKAIQFATLSSEYIRSRSVAEVTTATLEEKGFPRRNGPNDPRSGTMDRNRLCETCDLDCLKCQGHSMHIELPVPIINISFIPMVVKVLRSICFECSRLRDTNDNIRIINEDDNCFWDAYRSKKLNSVSNFLRKKKKCAHCNSVCADVSSKGFTVNWIFTLKDVTEMAIQKRNDPTIFVPDGLILPEEGVDATRCKFPMDNEFIRSCLLSISTEDLETLGFNPSVSHPANAVMEVLLVPPPLVRPAVRYSESSRHRSEHDFTIWIQEIIRSKSRVVKLLGESPTDTIVKTVGIRQATRAARNARNNKSRSQLRQQATDEFSGIICGYINCDSSAAKASASKRHRAAQSNRQSLMTVQSGKRGQWRSNTQGKRVDYSGRTVACPTVNLDPNEIGFPELFSKVLTHKTTVQSYNIEKMRDRVRIGDSKIEGATSVTLVDGTEISTAILDDMQRDTLAVELCQGMAVEHPMRNGQRVIQNRQPTLRRASMMAHRVVHERNSKVERVNTSVVGASNTDFDGDNLNAIKPRSEETEAEMQELMAVEKQIISAQSHKPLFGLIQDTVVGAYRLTSPGVTVTRECFMQCVTQAKDSSVIERFSNRYSSLRQLTGKQLFSSLLPNGFHYKQRIQRDTGSEIVEVVNGELVNGRICKRSIGATSGGIIHCLTRVCGPEAAMSFLGDCQRVVGWWLSQNALSIGLGDCLISKSSAVEVAATVDHAVRKADLLGLGVTDERQIHKVDIAISSCLRKVVTQAGNAALRAAPNPHCNAFKDTVDSAAKGTIVNLTQVLCCVGQQNAQGKRIGFSDERTLPCFAIPTPGNPNSASARGFVSNSFSRGLSPPEMFFHLIASRDALMDTSVRTSLSGYGQRKMTKAAEDVTLKYDGTARHSNGTIVTFVYGSDGMDSAKLDPVHIPELQYDMKSNGRAGNDEVIAILLRECREERVSIIDGMPSGTIYLPFNATQRLAQFTQPSISTSPDDSVVYYARERLERLCRLLREKEQGARTLFRTSFLRLHLRLELGEQKVANRLRNTELIGSLFDNLEHLYFRACVEAGEAVGLLAAENIAEPLTQLVLNVFHTAGIAQVASTQGIPRLNELIDASRNIKTPTMTLFACSGKERDLPVSDLPEKPLDAFVKQAHVFHQPGGIYSTEGMQHEDYSVDTENVTKMFLSEQRTVVNVTALLKRHLKKRYAESPEHHSPYAFVLILEDEANVEDIARLVRKYLGSSQGSENRYIMECSAPGMLHQFIRVRITNSSDITDLARKDINDRFPAWGQERVSQAVSELYHSMTHALLRKIMFNVRIGKMADVKESKLVSTNDNLSRYTGEPRITTSGSSLRAVWNVQEIDWKRSMTNDVIEVQNVLGIEAASTLLFHELREVITSGGSAIADRHISMIVSIMTCYGKVTPLTRYGDFRLGKNSAVVRASFEQQNAHIVDAGAFGEASAVVSLSDTIVVGCRPQMGTGAVTLLIDEKYLQDCKKKAASCEEISSAGGGGIVKALLSSDDLVSRNSEKGLMEMFMKRGPKTSNLPWIKMNGHNKSVSMDTEIENTLRVDPKDVISQIDMERIAIPKTGGSGFQEDFEDVSIQPAHMKSLQEFHPSSPKITNIDTKAADTDMATKQLCELLNTLQPLILKFQLPLYSEEGEISMEEFDRLVKNVL